MTIKYAYYPGCSLESLAREYNVSTRLVCQDLDIELVEIPDWNCCGAAPACQVDHMLSSALSARNLALAENLRLNVMAPCPKCFNRLKTVDLEMKDSPDHLTEINNLLEKPYNKGVQVKSLLQVLYQDVDRELISCRVKIPLEGLRVACYYGCMNARPADINDFQNPEDPTSMEEILAPLGAELVDYPLKTYCCGAAFGLARVDLVLRLANELLEMATLVGADVIAVACPLCQQNLDLRQPQVNARYGTRYNIPILYLTQLMGLAFGHSSKELWLDKHFVKFRKLPGATQAVSSGAR
ncbi:MAG: 8-methylmenaquinol:fumarate reductase membrane anchor subunit [Actinobacteria bacterium]|nr:8-methylmenaquinol:fumarate reductase membrane anchor subunit [Actinomycetota bacterium]